MKKTILASAISACLLASSLSVYAANENRPDKPNQGKPEQANTQAAQGGHKGQSSKKVKPGSLAKVIHTNRQVYYIGDTMDIRVVVPRAFKAAWEGDADTHLVLYGPGDITIATPVTFGGENDTFKPGRSVQVVTIDTLDTTALSTGEYQLALVATEVGGDPLDLDTWYEGFRGLLSVSKVKFSDQALGEDEDDLDGDGEIDGDEDGDGFEDDTSEYDEDDAADEDDLDDDDDLGDDDDLSDDDDLGDDDDLDDDDDLGDDDDLDDDDDLGDD
ncbi:hypothetical protein, partial [Candidatus Albibeggiatoa sp. nov. NOAA]|uniref:hypothetical protein n=1 Tax=Candidatus Albibeggiatoa sp. nov. NOAA TaxID=3162724 RepID=UPI0032F23F73|nr:hypothetical protein [Thiotrichaceae bacterium]